MPVNCDALAFSPDGGRLVAGGWDTVTVLDVAHPGDRRTVRVPAAVNAAFGGADDFLVASGSRVYRVGSRRDPIVVRSGLTIRRNPLLWGSGVGLFAWMGLWSLACWRLWQKQPVDARNTELYAWATVFATACVSAGHLGVLVNPTAWGDPLSLLGTLPVLWLLAVGVVIVMGILYSRRAIGFVCLVYCVLAFIGQACFDVYLWGEVAASV